MQTVLIFFAFEIHAAKLQDFPIVPPQKAANDEIEEIGHYDETPQRVLPDLGWGEP